MSKLKKLLCMMLAIALSLSILAIGASATFNDQWQIAHTNAVDKLVSWNIIKGKDQGNFDPSGNVTRAEMCKMICVALSGGKEPSLSTNSTPTYWDTNGHWGQKYVEYCNLYGIVAGNGNGEFQPDAYVTGYQAAKMLLTAMGFDSALFTGSGWELNTAVSAYKMGLFNSLNQTDYTSPINRDNAAQLIYNGITSPTPLYTGSTSYTGKSIYDRYYQNATPTPSTTPIPTPTPTPTPSSTSFESFVSSLGSATSRATAVSPFYLNQFMKIQRNSKTETYYKMNLQEGQGIAVALKAQINSGYMYLYLYDGDGNRLDYTYSIKNDNFDVVQWTAEENMTVYVRVSGDTGIYYLGFYDAYFNSGVSDSNRDFYGSLYTAKTIESGTFARNLEDQEDWYRVYVDEKGTLTVNLSPSLNSGYMYIYLYDKDGTRLDYTYSIGNGKTDKVEKTVATSGYYFVRVYGDVGKYKLSYSVS